MYPPVYPHEKIEKLYQGVFLLHGSIKMGPAIEMNRNMVILQNESDLTLINPVRLTEEGLASLDAMGEVKNLLRLGDFHGLDDAFYLDRYKCAFWAQSGQETYKEPRPTTEINSDTVSPFPDSEFFIFETARKPEAALLLTDHKLLITTDSIQYHADWSYFTFLAQVACKLMGFKIGINIGPPWLKHVTPEGGSMKKDFDRLMKLDFEAIIGAHGLLLPSGAKDLLAEEIRKVFK